MTAATGWALRDWSTYPDRHPEHYGQHDPSTWTHSDTCQTAQARERHGFDQVDTNNVHARCPGLWFYYARNVRESKPEPRFCICYCHVEGLDVATDAAGNEQLALFR